MKTKLITSIVIFLIVSTAHAADTVTAWGTLEIKGHALGANVTGAEISLSCAPQSVKRGVWNKFEFHNVACESGCQLTIKLQSPTTGETVTYSASYKFHKPSVLGGHRGKKAAGYLGDFLYDISCNRITYTSRY